METVGRRREAGAAPPHLRLGLVDLAEEGADAVDDALVALGVLAQEVLHREDRLGAHVVDVDLEEAHQLVDDDAGARGHLHPHPPDRVDGAARHRRVGVGDVFGDLLDGLADVLGVGDGGEDLELEQLDARRVVVPAVEVLEVVGEDGGGALRQQRDVLEAREALLEDAAGHQGQHRRLEAGEDLLVDGGHVLRQVEEHLRRGEHDGGVGVLQALLEQVHDVESLLLRVGLVPRDALEHQALRPLVEVLDPVEEVVDDLLVDHHPALGVEDLVERAHAVGDHLRVAVAQHRVQRVDEVGVRDGVGAEEVELDAAHHRRLPHVRALVLQPVADHLGQVLGDVGQPQAGERAEREPARHRVLVAAVLLQRVDREEREVGVRRRVVADVQVHHLLDHVVLRPRRHDHLGEELRA